MADVKIYFKGESFKPSKLKKLKDFKKLEILREAGEICIIGPHKDKPSPYGMAYMRYKFLSNIDKGLYLANNICVENHDLFLKSGITKLLFVIDVKTKSETITFDNLIFKNLKHFKVDIEININKK